MSKNLIVLFIIILLIVGGFGIYTYDQSNQAKKEVEEKNLKLESSDELILELKENIQDKEKQIEELEANLAKGEKDLEKEYTDKLSELTEEKVKLEALLTEKEETIKTIEKQKEESEQIVILKDELVLELKQNIQEKEKQIEELKANLVKGEKDLEEEYATKISELMAEKGQLEALLIEQEGISQTKDREKEELISKLENSNNQINQLKDKLIQQETEGEKDYVAELSALTEEKSTLETQLKTSQDLLSEKESAITVLKQQNEESEKSLTEKDKTVAELSESIKVYENQIREISELMAKEGKEKEAGYAESLALLKESKDIIEAKLAEAIKKNIPDYYEVLKGDSLWKIAERFYNAGEKWIRIFEANIDKIKNPSMIYPYQRLTIPKE
ncbi:MAG: LysM peptidoglycan-binding domain-containing protein [bacterium]